MLLASVQQAEEPVAILRMGDARVQQSEDGFSITYPAPKLTPDGVIVFGGVYPENEKFDPIVVRLRQETAMKLVTQGRGEEM